MSGEQRHTNQYRLAHRDPESEREQEHREEEEEDA